MKGLINSTFIILLIFSSSVGNYIAQTKVESLLDDYDKYKHEIKSLFENHFCNEFKFSPEMKSASIDFVERLIDGRPSSTYRECNYFISRRFEKAVYEKDGNISRDDIFLAEFRLEFVENILNNPEFQMIEADKINVEFGEYGGYCYVVVGVSTSWYEKNPGLWVFEKRFGY